MVLAGWLRNEFVAEQESGFSRLKRVPDSRVIHFLDHFTSLNPAQQSEITTILAEWSSHHVMGTPLPHSTYTQFIQATTFPNYATGIRYMGVNLLAGLANSVSNGDLAGWFQAQGVIGLALTPAATLLRDMADLVPVKIPTLRRLVKHAFNSHFALTPHELGDGIWAYEGTYAASALSVRIRYSGRMGRPQLQYEVTVRGSGKGVTAPNICFESILGVGLGCWDYLTRENAERSVGLLCELIEYVALLPGRLPNSCRLASI
jgi:hypothetical protein